ncbi:MAG: hypothetical protein U0524_03115 [Candidatus Saccharimonadales bacterium]
MAHEIRENPVLQQPELVDTQPGIIEQLRNSKWAHRIGLVTVTATLFVGAGCTNEDETGQALANPVEVERVMDTFSDANAPEPIGVTYRRSSLNIQKSVLNKIRHTATPVSREGLVWPTSATITADSAEFRTNCQEGPRGGSYRWYSIGENGYRYKPCDKWVEPFVQPPTTENQFKKPLNRIAKSVGRSVGIVIRQSAQKVTGNRQHVAAFYKCSSAEAQDSSDGQEYRKIAVNRQGHAALTECKS